VSLAADLADLARSFSRYLRAANRSERTVTTYAEATSQFTSYVTGLDDGPGTVADIDRSHVGGYLVDLGQRGRSPATLNNRYRALRRFFDFLVAEEELAEHPMARMSPPQVPDQPVAVLSEDDLRALLSTCATKSFEDVRDQAAGPSPPTSATRA
jgi:site-specific recombinase XerD